MTTGAIQRDGYRVDFQATTNVPAQCGTSWAQGQPFAYLYDFLAAAAGGLAHKGAIFLDTSTAPRTFYLVCKAHGAADEKELVLHVQ